MRVDVFEALLAEPGQRLLARAAEEYDAGPALALGTRLRREYDADLVAAALSQVELRRKAVGKLGAKDATRMYLTAEALEQATPRAVAEHRAARLASVGAAGGGVSDGGAAGSSASDGGAAGSSSSDGGASDGGAAGGGDAGGSAGGAVDRGAAGASSGSAVGGGVGSSRSRPRLADLGCGIGSDLVAAARAGLDVVGVERDPLRAAMARANLAALGLSGEVVVGDVEAADLDGFDVVFADPARRDARGRVFDPSAYSPAWSFVQSLLARRTCCVKIAPTIPHRLVPAGVEAEWVSEHGEVKEAALWSGALATASRRATVLPGGDSLADSAAVPAEVGPVAAYLYEPDGAVIRAGLVGDLAADIGAHLLDPRIAYLSADRQVPTPFARCYAVQEQLPFREKQLRAALRARDVGTLTVKKRGVDVTPEVLRRRLALRGSRPATVVLTRAGGAAVALLVTPLAP